MCRKQDKNPGNSTHEKTFNCFEIALTKEAEARNIFQWGWESDTILHFLKVDMLLPIYLNHINTWTSQILSKWYQNVGHRTSLSSVLYLTIYDDTKCSSCHIPYTYNIFHLVSSYYFQSYNKTFQEGNFNVNMRPDMLYFSIWGICSTRYKKRNLWPVKTAKTLYTSSRRFFDEMFYILRRSALYLFLQQAKGQKILNTPRMLCSNVEFCRVVVSGFVSLWVCFLQ